VKSEQILAFLENGPMSFQELRDAMGGRDPTSYITVMLRQGRIHVLRWIYTPSGLSRIFKHGPGENAPNPRAKKNAGAPKNEPAPKREPKKAEPAPSIRAQAIRKLADMGIYISEKSSVAEVSNAIDLVMPRGDNLITLHVELFVKPPVAPPTRFRNMERKEWRPGTHLRATEIAAHPRMWTPRTIIASGFQLQGGFD